DRRFARAGVGERGLCAQRCPAPEADRESRQNLLRGGQLRWPECGVQGRVGASEVPQPFHPDSCQLDYEGEIAMVIGRPGRRISETDAMQHVAGYTICNEGAIRDWIR